MLFKINTALRTIIKGHKALIKKDLLPFQSNYLIKITEGIYIPFTIL